MIEGTFYSLIIYAFVNIIRVKSHSHEINNINIREVYNLTFFAYSILHLSPPFDDRGSQAPPSCFLVVMAENGRGAFPGDILGYINNMSTTGVRSGKTKQQK